MKNRIPTWYEWHWQQTLPIEKERVEAKIKLVDVIVDQARIFDLIGQLAKATIRLTRGINVCADDSKLEECRLKNMLGTVHFHQGDYDKTMELSRYVAATLETALDEKSRTVYGETLTNVSSG